MTNARRGASRGRQATKFPNEHEAFGRSPLAFSAVNQLLSPDFPAPFNRRCASCSWRSLSGCRLGTHAGTCCGSGARSMRRLESRRGRLKSRLKSLRPKATRQVPLEMQVRSIP